MSIAVIFLIAFGLCFDTLAVSMSCGMTTHFKMRQIFRFGAVLAFFQFLMPLLGWFMGSVISGLLSAWDHWIAFGLLLILGLKMVFSSFRKEDERPIICPHALKTQCFLGLATSIDALAVGVSIALLRQTLPEMFGAALIIGAVTYTVAVLGLRLGKRIGHLVGNRAELLGGLVLIGIGIKIVIEHMS